MKNKTPSIEDIKEYFRDAQVVRSADLPQHYNDVIDISDRSIFDERQVHFYNNAYWLCKKEISNSILNFMLWDKEKGYAEIISYTKPKQPYIKIPLSEIKNCKDDKELAELVRSIAENY